MEVLSPRSSNVPMKPRKDMKKIKPDSKPDHEEKPSNPDRIDEKWRPPLSVTEPGPNSETYTTGKKLGKGGFAVCFEGTANSTSKLYALKVVKAKVEQKKMMEKFRTELQIHAKMQHPNIVEFLKAFTSDNYTYVVLELCPNGNLTDMVKARSCLSLPEVRRYMIQICGGVKYMHKRSVIHRDLKMGNIFLDTQMNLKIGDFGLAAVMADEQDRRTTLCGTPNYIAPEILSKTGTRGHDNKVDTWAIGVICYAMLMGTPPFQSKTQQEIYAKLKTLEYEWKIDSKNYIPQQAKDFVASCLNLVSAERPEMDDLVEHEFFTMGVVADTLDTKCLKEKPRWLENADPRGDKVIPGYGITHSKICREAGVGRTPDGRPLPAAGAKANISTLLEIEAENQHGCAPIVPLPEGVLYNAFSEAQAEWSIRQKRPLLPVKQRGRKLDTEHGNLASLEMKVENLEIDERRNLVPGAKLIPPTVSARTVPSFAAQQRLQALPARAVQPTIASGKPVIASSLSTVENVEPASTGLLKARPMRATTSRVTRSATLRDVAASIPSKTISKSNTVPSGMQIADDVALKKPAVTITASRIRERIADRSEALRSSEQLPLIFQDETATCSRSESMAFSSSDENPNRVLQTVTANNKQAKPRTDTQFSKGENEFQPKCSTSPTLLNCRPHIISSTEPYTRLSNTSSANVLASLQHFYETTNSRLTEDINSKHFSVGLSRRSRAATPYPRVDKWVDYSTRHGIAYILTDGTLGMILKSSEDNSRPSSCVVVRNAKAHTIKRAKGLEDQFVPQGQDAGAVEFYEQSNTAADMKKLAVPACFFMLDMQTHGSQTTAANAIQARLQGHELERMKEVGLLDKFGKYMNKQIGDVDESVEPETRTKPSDHFIHFYQRLGNVGVWRFADGGLQFNFPDHTKLTIYQHKTSKDAEYLIDLVYLEPKDARTLAKQGVVTTAGLERRGLITLHLSEIISGSLRKPESDIVESNEIKEKISWIRAVIGCWIKEGGIGRMGEEKLGWGGLQERREDKRIKLQWVTVGRLGGDGDIGTTAASK